MRTSVSARGSRASVSAGQVRSVLMAARAVCHEISAREGWKLKFIVLDI